MSAQISIHDEKVPSRHVQHSAGDRSVLQCVLNVRPSAAGRHHCAAPALDPVLVMLRRHAHSVRRDPDGHLSDCGDCRRPPSACPLSAEVGSYLLFDFRFRNAKNGAFKVKIQIFKTNL